MGIFKANGTRVTKSTVPTAAVSAADTPKALTEDLYTTRSYGRTDPMPEGSVKTLFAKAGAVFTQRELDNLFDPASITSISPATGPQAGGTVVTISGDNLDGVTGITFGGTAGTNLVVVSAKSVKVTTPAKAAGAVTVAVTDDSGPVSQANGYTFV